MKTKDQLIKEIREARKHIQLMEEKVKNNLGHLSYTQVQSIKIGLPIWRKKLGYLKHQLNKIQHNK